MSVYCYFSYVSSSRKRWIFTVAVLFFSFFGFQCKPSAIVMALNAEGQSLLSWKNTLNGLQTLDSWNASHPDACDWIGIVCSRDGSVSAIDLQSVELLGSVPSQFSALKSLKSLVLSSANLSGPIPKEIGDYSSLVTLDLSDNKISGRIPAEIGNLRNLETLILSSNLLEGSIPAELGSCINLVNLWIFDNHFNGSIPADIGKLSNLQLLRAGGNADISGHLPSELGNCIQLTVLGIAETSISGTIPKSFGRLKKLRVLSLFSSLLSGPIPSELGNCTELSSLYLYCNHLSGSLPRELGRLTKLERLLLWQNNLSGFIPIEIGNNTALKVIDLSLNSIAGTIPETIGHLTELTELQLSGNNMSGSIPAALMNCSRLLQLQLDRNHMSGKIPEEIGNLQRLEVFFAWNNSLQGTIPAALGNCKELQSLDLTNNRLTGTIPRSIFLLENLTKLLLISNYLSGTVPKEIGDCKSLIRLRLGKNRLSGIVPAEIGKLTKLIFLDMAENRFTGSIPEQIGNCFVLEMLDLHGNHLTGYVPAALGSLSHLHVLDLSTNMLSGSIPDTIGDFSLLNKLSLNRNRLSGRIPEELSKCGKLQYLDLSGNDLEGGIPNEIGNIEGLEIALNLSWNRLSGSIPWQFSRLTKLTALDLSHNMLSGNLSVLGALDNLLFLNVSFNNFSGILPDTDIFRELGASSMMGNPLLSGAPQACISEEEQPKRLNAKVIITVAFSVVGFLCITGGCVLITARQMRRKKRLEEPEMEWPWQIIPFQKLNFSIEDVLACLVDGNIIGKGCSGVVYKAEIPGRDTVAVKKLWLCNNKKDKQQDSFAREIRTLGSIRHKNIVKLLGYCTNNSAKLLIYDYMPNGCLGDLLHHHQNAVITSDNISMLDWDQRYNIILGTALGLEYLHHHCVPPIIHRDVKPNNILLDCNFEPHLADFGLAKLLLSSPHSTASSSKVAGSYGYIAPEYGYMTKITEKSDVYSYGVVLLEVLTGKPAVIPDEEQEEGIHLAEWVKRSLERNMMDSRHVIDARLQGKPHSQLSEMGEALGVALLCVNPFPDGRPSMKDVVALLKHVRQPQLLWECSADDSDNTKIEIRKLLAHSIQSPEIQNAFSVSSHSLVIPPPTRSASL